MAAVEILITDHLDLWTAALQRKSTAGRGASSKVELYGIKKLRELILELAVRGLLVPQDPNDEPASELLKKIAAEKATLVKAGKIKKETSPAEINDEEARFALPKSWKWIVLGNLVEVLDSQRKPITKTDRNAGPYPYYGASGVVDYVAEYIFDEPLVLVGEDGAKWGRGDSTAFAICGKTWVNNHAHVLRPNRSCVLDSYLVYFLTVTDLNEYITGMTVPKLNQARLVSIPVALPPLAEQHRIVAKVDELMALCDQLEQQTEASLGAHQMLVETLLSALTGAADHVQFASAWQRIAGHFDTLFTTEESIDLLKQTILQLAVMGKLVPQDPDDEQARVLLERIKREKARLLGEGAIRKEKPLSDISADEIPFDLPDGWAWTRLGEIVFIKGGKRVSNGYQLLSTPTPYIYIRVSDMKDGTIDDADLKYIDEGMYSKIRQYIITKHDVYMTIVGATIGKCGLVPDKFDGMNLTENAARLSPVIASKPYLYKTLSSVFCQSQFIDKTKQVGVQKMALNRLASTLFPLPPLAEQYRIVAKVDELMALCDQLKSRLSDAQTTQLHLADALVERAIG